MIRPRRRVFLTCIGVLILQLAVVPPFLWVMTTNPTSVGDSSSLSHSSSSSSALLWSFLEDPMMTWIQPSNHTHSFRTRQNPDFYNYVFPNFPKQVRNLTNLSTGSTSSGSVTNAKVQLPILVVGLPKAGTSSLFHFFSCHGFASQHWYCCGPQRDAQRVDYGNYYMSDCMLYNLHHNRSILDGCGQYDVYTELNGPRRVRNTGQVPWGFPLARIFLPQHFQLQQLHDFAPNATWILNTRPIEDWIRSLWKWNRQLPRELVNEIVFQRQASRKPIGRLEHQEFLRQFYQIHIETVRTFVQNHPSHYLIELDISKNDTAATLTQALGGDNPPTNSGSNKSGSATTGSSTGNDDARDRRDRFFAWNASCWKNVNQNAALLPSENKDDSNLTKISSRIKA